MLELGLIFFYEVTYYARTVPGMLCRPPKVILQVPVAPKPSKIIKISMIFMDSHRNPNETSVKHSLMGFWNANVLTPAPKWGVRGSRGVRGLEPGTWGELSRAKSQQKLKNRAAGAIFFVQSAARRSENAEN